MSYVNYQYYGSSKENKVNIFEGSQIKTRSICSKQAPQSHVMVSKSTDTVQKSDPNIVITSKEQILSSKPDIFEGIGSFPGPPYHIQVTPNTTPKQTLY